MKVAELEAPLLDYWAAKAERLEIDQAFEKGLHPHLYVFIDGDLADFAPSSNWAQGGPIIAREGITLLDPKFCDSGLWEAYMGAFPDVRKYSIVGMVAQGAGPTPLIAAMRALVASKFGDTVEDAQPGSAG